jgi:hypothetical protein
MAARSEIVLGTASTQGAVMQNFPAFLRLGIIEIVAGTIIEDRDRCSIALSQENP